MKTRWPPSNALAKVNVIQQNLQGFLMIWGPKSLESFISVEFWQLQQDALDLCWNKWKVNHISNLSPEERRNKPSWNSQFTIFCIRKVLGLTQSKAMSNLSTALQNRKCTYTADQMLLQSHLSVCYCFVIAGSLMYMAAGIQRSFRERIRKKNYKISLY